MKSMIKILEIKKIHVDCRPMMVVAPLLVAETTASIKAFVPAENLLNSNTPGGLPSHHQYKYIYILR